MDDGRAAEGVGEDVDLVIGPPRDGPIAWFFAPFCEQAWNFDPRVRGIGVQL